MCIPGRRRGSDRVSDVLLYAARRWHGAVFLLVSVPFQAEVVVRRLFGRSSLDLI